MPRKSRIDAAGAIHHVMVRGIERGAVYRGDSDRNIFWTAWGASSKMQGQSVILGR